MKFYEAAIKSLEENNNLPMSSREIWDYIEARGWVTTNGSTPDATMNTVLLSHSDNSNIDITKKRKPYFTCVGERPIKFKLLSYSPTIEVIDKFEPYNKTQEGTLQIVDKSLDWKCLSYKNINEKIIYSLEECAGYTYIVEDMYHTTVKIGKTSNNPELRLSQLRTSNPSLELLLVFPISLYTEEELHKKFNDFRKDREWFFYASKLRSFIEKEADKSKILLNCYNKHLELMELEKELKLTE